MLVKRLGIVVALLLLLAITATPANNAEELVFSKTGGFMTLSGNSIATSTPFGFWIWCAFHASPSSTPVTYQSAQVCSGSMYFYALGVPQHTVSAFSITEGPNNSYTFPVVGLNPKTQAPDFACVMHNNGPITSGATNTIIVTCPFFSSALGGGTGVATVTDAVVNDTGPK